MKKIGILGLALCAVSLTALAKGYVIEGDGFSGSAGSDPVNATWSENVSSLTVADGVYLIDNDKSNAVTLTPNSPKDGSVVIELRAQFTASDTVADLPPAADMSDAQAGLTVARDGESAYAYYGFVKGAAEWSKLGGTPDLENVTAVTIKIDYATKKVTFSVGGTALGEPLDLPAEGTPVRLNEIDCFGAGSLASINAQYTYATAAAALEAAGAENRDKIMVEGAAGSAGEQVAANGLRKWECAALGIGEDEPLKPVPTDDTDAEKITLALSNVQPEAGLSVSYQVRKNGVDSGSACPGDAIKIPLETGNYTVVPVIQVPVIQ